MSSWGQGTWRARRAGLLLRHTLHLLHPSAVAQLWHCPLLAVSRVELVCVWGG